MDNGLAFCENNFSRHATVDDDCFKNLNGNINIPLREGVHAYTHNGQMGKLSQNWPEWLAKTAENPGTECVITLYASDRGKIHPGAWWPSIPGRQFACMAGLTTRFRWVSLFR